MSDNVIFVDFNKPKVEEQHELIVDYDLFNSHDWPTVSITYDPLTPEDFPPPRLNKTLLGWEVAVFDSVDQEWSLLPEYYETECAALTAAEAMLLAIDFELSIDFEPEK